MKDIDWSKAPEGATHYNAAEGRSARLFSWMQKAEATWYFFDGSTGRWVRQYDFPEVGDKLIARPTTPQWNGTGRPPVGVVCNMRINDGRDTVVEVLCFGETRAFVRTDHTGDEWAPRLENVSFSAAPTPEQIAAEERAAGVQAMQAMQAMQAILCRLPAGTRLGAEELYDAGYRMTAEDER